MKYLLSLVLIVVSNFSVANNITEAEVRQVMNQMERAVKTRNLENIAALMSDTVVLNLHIFNGNSYETVTLDKAGYLQYTKGAWNMIKNYTYRYDSEAIEIEQDQAVLKYEITESMAWGNQYFKLRSKGTTVFKKENDKLLVVKVDARTI